MNLKKYEDYFHDGGINNIKQNDENIEFFMESCEILPEWKEVDIKLSKCNTITGKLILSGIKKITIDDKALDKIIQIYDDAGILDFDIYEDHVRFLLEWFNNFPKEQISKWECIIIFASHVEWENIPDLLDNK